MTEFIDAKKLTMILLSRWKIIITVTVLSGLIGFFYAMQQSPVYDSTATLSVSRMLGGTELDPDDFEINDELTLLYADLARRQPILQATIDALGLPIRWQTLRRQVRAQPVPNTDFVEVLVEASNPDVASDIANEITRQLIGQSPSAVPTDQEALNRDFVLQRVETIRANILSAQERLDSAESALTNALRQPAMQVDDIRDEIRELEDLIASWDSTYSRLLIALNAGHVTNQLSIFQMAQPNLTPVRPQVAMLTLLALLAGVVLALGVVFMVEFTNVLFRSVEEATNVLEIPPIGKVSHMHVIGIDPQDALLLSQTYQARAIEDYRLLFSKLDFIYRAQERRIVLVTSASPSDGKSTTTANLGIIMAQAGYRTIIVDANFRSPVQHTLFNLRVGGGLTELLNTPLATPDRMLKKTRVDNLSIITCGDLRIARPEQLSSQRAKELVWELYNLADVVLIDSPEAVGVADVLLMAHLADDVIFVLGAGNTTRSLALEAINNLRQAGAHLSGLVWNETQPNRTSRSPFGIKMGQPVPPPVSESASVKP